MISHQESLCAAHVSAFARVDADFFAFVDEGGNLDDEAGLGLGGLGDAGGSGRFQAGLGFDDRQLDRRGQVDADSLAVVVADLDLQFGVRYSMASPSVEPLSTVCS